MKTIQKDTQKEIGQYVAEDYRTASVFSKYGVDFCCKGDRTLEDVCNKKAIKIDAILHDLDIVMTQKGEEHIDFKSWPLDLLIDYIEKKHHRYVESKSPVLIQYLEKLCKVHGHANPELYQIFDEFKKATGELASHMKKEELILFPFIKKLVKAHDFNTQIDLPHFGSAQNPIAMMKEEHDIEGERFRLIAELSHNYQPPAHACNTYKVAYNMLNDFEKDLHKHIHLENNILFPKALSLEAKVFFY